MRPSSANRRTKCRSHRTQAGRGRWSARPGPARPGRRAVLRRARAAVASRANTHRPDGSHRPRALSRPGRVRLRRAAIRPRSTRYEGDHAPCGRVTARCLEHGPDAADGFGQLVVPLPVERRAPAGGGHEPEQHPQRRGLAGSVGSEQRGDVPGRAAASTSTTARRLPNVFVRPVSRTVGRKSIRSPVGRRDREPTQHEHHRQRCHPQPVRGEGDERDASRSRRLAPAPIRCRRRVPSIPASEAASVSTRTMRPAQIPTARQTPIRWRRKVAEIVRISCHLRVDVFGAVHGGVPARDLPRDDADHPAPARKTERHGSSPS